MVFLNIVGIRSKRSYYKSLKRTEIILILARNSTEETATEGRFKAQRSGFESAATSKEVECSFQL